MDAQERPNFEALVEQFYRLLYQFGLSLTGSEADAADLTQQTCLGWARKGHQLRDVSKVKTWLFTTLHREFLKTRRRQSRFPHRDLGAAEAEIAPVSPAVVNELDAKEVIAAVARLNEPFHAAVALFYLDGMSYREIAEILDVPIGTVESRIARGRAQLQRLLMSNHG
jgi:RNA polymerase sigma-70 factor (ECF subfamily)